MKNNSFQVLLQRFFLERLINQMNASPCTVSSYRDSFRIFLKYMKAEKDCAPSKVTLEMCNADNILDFLKYLESVRKNSIKTRNNRLAAIHSFMEYVSFQVPEYLALIQRVKSIPFKKTETRAMDYLVAEEIDALLAGCDLNCWLGRRDRIMIAMLYNTGVRVSELVSMKKKDVTLNPNGRGTIRVLGKGRKERAIPLWKTTQNYLAEFFKESVGNDEEYLFIDQRGEKLTRSGAAFRLKSLAIAASEQCPSLRKKRITPHLFRHTTPMYLLKSGVDISTIAIWLGHESIETTHKYMVADLQLKEQALAKTKQPQTSNFRYKPTANILSFLDALQVVYYVHKLIRMKAV